MKIKMTQTAKHAGLSYTKDDQLTVNDELGHYFCTCGWAKCLDGNQPPLDEPAKSVTLEVQNGSHGHSAQHV